MRDALGTYTIKIENVLLHVTTCVNTDSIEFSDLFKHGRAACMGPFINLSVGFPRREPRRNF